MLRSTFSSLREYLTPVSHTSTFQKTGQITPEEFVKAGDYLVYKFPTWSWSAASPSKRRDFLPEDKQFLVTQHVPSHARATANAEAAIDEREGDDGEWILSKSARDETSATQQSSAGGSTPAPEGVVHDTDSVVDVDDLDALGIADSEEGHNGADQAGAPVDTNERTYNVYITYSTSYRVPKAYLSGFDSNGAPLPPRAMFSDIVGDYKDKTVTIESAPFQESLTLISIHPCRHAGVMRMLLDMADAKTLEEAHNNNDGGDEWEEVPQGLRVDQYLIIFLKFIASVTPTIEHDFTMSAL